MDKRSFDTELALDMGKRMHGFQGAEDKAEEKPAVPFMEEKVTKAQMRTRFMETWSPEERAAWMRKNATKDDPKGTRAALALVGNAQAQPKPDRKRGFTPAKE